jgi:uncharacterized coiled-coil DUF342 family protein
MGHYDFFYAKQSRKDIEDAINEKIEKLEKLDNEYKELNSDLEKNISVTGLKIINDEIRKLETRKILYYGDFEKTKELLVRFDNGEKITYEQIPTKNY